MSAALNNRIYLALSCFIAAISFLVSGLYFSNGNNLVGLAFGVCAVVWIVLTIVSGQRVNAAGR